MRRTSTRFTVLFSVLLFVLALMPGAPASASDLDNRPVVTYPSSDTLTTMTDAGFEIPRNIYQFASFNDADGIDLMDNANTSVQGFAYLEQPIDLATHDLSFTYNLWPPSGSDASVAGNDFGSAFVLFNSTFAPAFRHYYGALGIYGTRGAEPIGNAIAVEFDNMNNTYAASYDSRSDSLVPTSTRGHIAITRPVGDSVTHQAISPLSSTYSNNQLNTARITWTLTNPGATGALTDNFYTLRYEYFQGASSAAGTATAFGSVTYSYSDMVAAFGGTTVRVGLSASSGALIKGQTALFPATYPYTINYLSRKADGSATATPIAVKGLTAKSERLPAGTHNVGPLPAAPTGYELVMADNPSLNQTISSTATNAFTYYYRDLAPTISGIDAIEVERINQHDQPPATAFDPRASVTATDGADGDLTDKVSVTGTVDQTTLGAYTLTYTVSDSVGNVTTATRQVTVVDRTAPQPPVINPIPEATRTVTGTAEPGSTVTITWPDGTSSTVTAGTDGKWTASSTKPLMGTQTVTATATDASNNTSQPGSYTVLIEYVSTTITKLWVDATGATTHPDTTIQVLQDDAAHSNVSVPPGQITETGDSFTVEQLPRYVPDATEATEYVYTVTENPAPTGYTATVTGNRADGFTVTNTRIVGTAVVNKTNPEGAGIAGASYELFTAAGVSQGTATTDVNGQARLTAKLPVGDYYVVETQAPPGYRLATEQHSFTVSEAGEIRINVVDHQIVDQFPITGTLGALPFQLGGAALLLVAALTKWRLRPRPTKNLRAPNPDAVTQPLTQTKEP